MFSSWPALLLLMFCLWVIVPGEFQRVDERSAMDLRGMRWVGAEEKEFHASPSRRITGNAN